MPAQVGADRAGGLGVVEQGAVNLNGLVLRGLRQVLDDPGGVALSRQDKNGCRHQASFEECR